MGRTEKKYGLTRLTFAEAARVLDIEEAALEVFVMKAIRPGSDRWTKWSNGTLPLPEVVIRLYLTWRLRTLEPAPPTPEPEETSDLAVGLPEPIRPRRVYPVVRKRRAR